MKLLLILFCLLLNQNICYRHNKKLKKDNKSQQKKRRFLLKLKHLSLKNKALKENEKNNEGDKKKNEEDKTKEDDLSNGEKLQEYYKKLDTEEEKGFKEQLKTLQLESTQSFEYRIRLKGSYTLYLVDFKENLNDKENKYYTRPLYKPEFNPFEFARRFTAMRKKNNIRKQQIKKESIMVNGQSYEREDIMKLNLFLSEKVELPFNCKFSLTKEEEIIISQQGKQLKKCWEDSAGDGASTFIDLPWLKADEFSKFYRCAAEAGKIEIDKEKHPEIEDIMWKSKEIMSMVLYGDTESTVITWLEYWVYACAKGKFIPPYQYMFTDKLEQSDISNIKVITDIIYKQQYKLQNRVSQAPKKQQNFEYSRSSYVQNRFNKRQNIKHKQ